MRRFYCNGPTIFIISVILCTVLMGVGWSVLKAFGISWWTIFLTFWCGIIWWELFKAILEGR